MIFTIDENICKQEGLATEELLALLLIRTGIDIPELLQNMIQKEFIIKDDLFDKYIITHRWNDIADKILLDSDKAAPKEDRMINLALKLMSIFDKGKKDGKYYFKGNKREISLKLKKFFKLYGNKYTDEQIIQAATKYVESFNGNYTYMRLLKYFICKDERKEDADGVYHIEETSELATYLDNMDSDDSDERWTTNLV